MSSSNEDELYKAVLNIVHTTAKDGGEDSEQCDAKTNQLMQLVTAYANKARKDELKKVNQHILSGNYCGASQTKWYRYHADRIKELTQGEQDELTIRGVNK